MYSGASGAAALAVDIKKDKSCPSFRNVSTSYFWYVLFNKQKARAVLFSNQNYIV